MYLDIYIYMLNPTFKNLGMMYIAIGKKLFLVLTSRVLYGGGGWGLG